MVSNSQTVAKHRNPFHSAGAPIWIGIALFITVSFLLSYRLHAQDTNRNLRSPLLASFANFSHFNETHPMFSHIYMWRVYGKYRVSVTASASSISRQVGTLLPGDVFLSESSLLPSRIVYPIEGYIHATSAMIKAIDTSSQKVTEHCADMAAVGIDLKGNDLTDIPTHADTPIACCAVCVRSNGCYAWTWTPSKDCWLKTSEASKEADTANYKSHLQAVSGIDRSVITSGVISREEKSFSESQQDISCPLPMHSSELRYPPSSLLRSERRGIEWINQWPIGNGLSGALVGGSVNAQVVPISIAGLFIGGTKRRSDKNSYQHFSTARDHLMNNRFTEATAAMSKLERSRTLGMFQYLADIITVFSPSPLSISNVAAPPTRNNRAQMNLNRNLLLAKFIKFLGLPLSFLSEEPSTVAFGKTVYSQSFLDTIFGVAREVHVTSSVKDARDVLLHTREWFASASDDVIVGEFRCFSIQNSSLYETSRGCLNVALQFSRDVSNHDQVSNVHVTASPWEGHRYNPSRSVHDYDMQVYAISVMYAPSSEVDSTSSTAVACSLVLCRSANATFSLLDSNAVVICNDADMLHVITATELRSYDDDDKRNIEQECFAKLAVVPDIDSIRRQHEKRFESDMLATTISLDPIEQSLSTNGPCELVLSSLFDIAALNSTDDKNHVYLLSSMVWFSKYLLLSSTTRHVANLQGLWADGPTSAWSGDYHLNINMQMIYWPMNALGLTLSLKHLDDFIVNLSHHGRETARDYYNARGWVAHGFTDHSMNSDLLADCQWSLCVSCGAWLSLHMWEKLTYYPCDEYQKLIDVYRGVAEFVFDYATQDCDGTVLLGPTTSPENSYYAVTPNISSSQSKYVRSVQQLTMSTAIDSAVLKQIAEAYEILIDMIEPSLPPQASFEYRNTSASLSHLLRRLPNRGYPIIDTKSGKIREYNREVLSACNQVNPTLIEEDVDVGHRHFSSLLWLYPGLLNVSGDHRQQLEKAAKVLLNAKEADGGAHTGWSAAWAAALWARLGNRDATWRHIKHIMRRYVSANLMGLHPPLEPHGKVKCPTCFREEGAQQDTIRGLMESSSTGRGLGLMDNSKFQIDTNAGMLAAILEGIVQSHERNVVKLSPALPTALESGYVRNIHLRGDMSLSMVWRRGQIAAAAIEVLSSHHWLQPRKNRVEINIHSSSPIRVIGEWVRNTRSIKRDAQCVRYLGDGSTVYAVAIAITSYPCAILVCHRDRSNEECIEDIRIVE